MLRRILQQVTTAQGTSHPPSGISHPSQALYGGLACLTWGSGTFLLSRYPNSSVDLALEILIKEAAAFYVLMSVWNNFS